MIKFLQAKHFRNGPRRPTRIVIHTAEIGETLDGAEALMRACAVKRIDAKGKEIVSSWHYSVDADSVCQSVHEEDVAFAAPGANHDGIQIELCGYARQSAAEWQDAYSIHQLELLAQLVADICARWDIPICFLNAEALKLGVGGITTHAEVSKAFRKSDHWDPGPNFPMDWLLARVLFKSAPDTEPAPARDP